MAAVITLVIVAPLVAGCINIISPTPTPAVPTPIPTTTHNPILESAVSWLMPNDTDGYVHYDKHVTWNGGNIVTVSFIEAGRIKELINATPLASNTTLMVFATTQDATKYIDSIDKSYYLLSDRPFDTNDSAIPTAIRALGVPSVYQHWSYLEGFGTPNEKFGDIYQFDNIVQLNSDWAV